MLYYLFAFDEHNALATSTQYFFLGNIKSIRLSHSSIGSFARPNISLAYSL